MGVLNIFRRKPQAVSPHAAAASSARAPRFGTLNLRRLFAGKTQAAQKQFYETLEETLIAGDVGGKEAVRLVAELQKHAVAAADAAGIPFLSADEQLKLLHQLLSDFLIEGRLSFNETVTPLITLIGINGGGKTTTLAKLANLFKDQYAVVLGAGDTFRAAAPEQLKYWAEKLQLPLISKGTGADSAAIAYDLAESLIARTQGSGKRPMGLLDTAGRLHTQGQLMDELKKVFRILGKFTPPLQVIKLLVLDVTLGQNVLRQAEVFHRDLSVDGLILTKCDTAARAGTMLSVAKSFALPIYYCTHGETLDDIEAFVKAAYLRALLGEAGTTETAPSPAAMH